MSPGSRAWWIRALRLLPGGHLGALAGVVVTGGVWLVCMPFTLIGAFVFRKEFPELFGSQLNVLSLANGPPLLLIAVWAGLRVRLTKPLEPDEAAVDLRTRRVYFGDDVTRVPKVAVAFSIRPRRAGARLADGRGVTASFRVNADAADLVRLARVMQEHAGLAVEDWVHLRLEALARDMLPDPDGIREALGRELLELGVVVTRFDVEPARGPGGRGA